MSECNGNCSSCGQKGGCDSPLKKLEQNKDSKIKKVIGIVSGKGGVGKSLTTASLASVFQSKGYKTAIIDGDITGASIPNMFGLENGIASDGEYMIPAITKTGIKAISINLLLETPDSPVVWRGSMLSNVLKQFWTDVKWGDIDYMFIDMPPGTGDIPLTAFQSLPIDGIVIVTSPQDLVSMIVKKAYNMAKIMNIPIIGIIENMSYIECSDCGKRIYPFGEGKADLVAKELGVKLLAKNPINPTIAKACDDGNIENISLQAYDDAANMIIDIIK